MSSSIDKQTKPPEHSATGWTIKSLRTQYETPWIKVGEYKAIAPTGVDATYGVVSFKNLAVGMLPLEANGITYLVGQHRFSLGQYSWEVPEGGGPLNEEPIHTAKRELSEEINKQAQHWYPLFENLHLSNSVTDERAFGYIASGLSQCHEHMQDDVEDLAIWALPVGQAVQMVVNGQITDALSLAILLKADHLWRTGQLPENIADAFAAGQI